MLFNCFSSLRVLGVFISYFYQVLGYKGYLCNLFNRFTVCGYKYMLIASKQFSFMFNIDL
jgi:hypothetical protein